MAQDILHSQKFKLKFSDSIGVDWRVLGCWLNIGDTYLDMIDHDNKFTKDKAYSMLTKWIQMNDNPTVEELKSALQNMKRMDLVKRVEKLTKISNLLSKLVDPKIFQRRDLSAVVSSLKKFYLQTYGCVNELNPILNKPSPVNLLNNYVELCIVDAVKAHTDAVYSVERDQFLKKRMNYTPIPFNDVFLKERSLILISGIAGIGKTWLLKKVILDWSNNIIWKNIDLVFYFECRRLNQHQDISSINNLIMNFYKDILKDFDISHHNIMFVIDGLDEFIYFDELVSYYKCSNPIALKPIVKTLANIHNYKAVIAGRIYAIDQYENVSTEYNDKQTIQIMGFNENGINYYIETNVIEELKTNVKRVFIESPIAKSMSSVPFYLSCICKIIEDTMQRDVLFITMTDLYTRIFLYFLKQHVNKDNDAIYEMLDKEENKKYILKICKLAYYFFIEKKIVFTYEEVKKFNIEVQKTNVEDKEVEFSVDKKLFGFIERINTHEGYLYQFAHLSIMEFCASLHVYNNFTNNDMVDIKLKSCFPMIFGLTNRKLFLFKFLSNLKSSNTEDISLFEFCEPWRTYHNLFDYKLFYECFYESQLSFKDVTKSFADKQQWEIWIDDGKTSYETSCEYYFVHQFINSGRQLTHLHVHKNVLNIKEKDLVIKCSTNVRYVSFYHPIKLEGLNPKHNIDLLSIHISNYLITKKDFKENFLPWINVCKELDLYLHDNIDFIESIYKWVCCLDIKKFFIKIFGKEFCNLDEFKNFLKGMDKDIFNRIKSSLDDYLERKKKLFLPGTKCIGLYDSESEKHYENNARLNGSILKKLPKKKTEMVSKLRILEESFETRNQKDLSKESVKLKEFYQKHYGIINELQPLLKSTENVDLVHKFVDLCIVNAVDTQMDVNNVDRKSFIEKQMSYAPISYNEIFSKETSVITVSGIAGIGKTCLLRKCLLDWSSNKIWENIDLLFYFECGRLNQHQNISSINELINVFYKDVDFDINNQTVMFVIDGLDEFKYFNDLINPSSSAKYPIVNALAEIQKYKHVIAGRVYAIDQYQSISMEHNNKLSIQIMGFDNNGVTNYIENNVIEEKKELVRTTLKESPIEKFISSVPFYLSCMCKVIVASQQKDFSFLTKTDLYANIFLYFYQKHIIKNNKLIYQIMENKSNKKNILNICKIAYQLFVESKVIFSREEIQTFISDFDKIEVNLFGLIERIETNLGYHYQFCHLTMMEFCASVYAYNSLSSKEIMADKKLNSCLSMIYGLNKSIKCGINKIGNDLLDFFINLNPLKNKDSFGSLPLFSIFDLSSFNKKLFMECVYESQSSIDDIKSFVDKEWSIWIDEGKPSYETSCENYFVNHLINLGRKLTSLVVGKNILDFEEKKLVINSSTRVRRVYLYHPVKIEEWEPKGKIERLMVSISNHLISKKEFEDVFLPWIRVCEVLNVSLHDDIDFITDIYEWTKCSNIKKFSINHRGKYYNYTK